MYYIKTYVEALETTDGHHVVGVLRKLRHNLDRTSPLRDVTTRLLRLLGYVLQYDKMRIV